MAAALQAAPQGAERLKSLYKYCLYIRCERDVGQKTSAGLWDMIVAGTVPLLQLESPSP